MCVCIPEFELERVLGTNVGFSLSSWGPAASQVFGVPGPAGQIDRLLWRHWDGERGKKWVRREERKMVRKKLEREVEGHRLSERTKLPPTITLASSSGV